MTVDEEGYLWVAFWEARRSGVSPQRARVDSIVELPVTQVTSCAFGGEDLADLYVTSGSRVRFSPEPQLREQPDAGGLFRVRPGARGLPPPPFDG